MGRTEAAKLTVSFVLASRYANSATLAQWEFSLDPGLRYNNANVLRYSGFFMFVCFFKANKMLLSRRISPSGWVHM